MALTLILQSVAENKTVASDGTEIIESYDISVVAVNDTAQDKILASKVIRIAGGQNAEDSKTEFKDKIRSWWQGSLAEFDRKVNLRSIANDGIAELLIE